VIYICVYMYYILFFGIYIYIYIFGYFMRDVLYFIYYIKSRGMRENEQLIQSYN